MGKKMLIDAAHPEETRVAVVQDNRVEEFDFESSTKSRVRGNIYLAKVTRIEPSLQAAFVDYGGNRHGFLAFNEIHPDYYQIPAADREALLAAEAELEERTRALDVEDVEVLDVETDEVDDNASALEESANETTTETTDEASEADQDLAETNEDASAEDDTEDSSDTSADNANTMAAPEEDASDETSKTDGDNGLSEARDTRAQVQRLRRQKMRHYKIQEVIKRRQVLLVQVVKEERGNKGAALTSYMSLAGRYCVLMPNTGRGGGISRKITNMVDRKRLKGVVADLDVPEGMGLIIRTAGSKRTKIEIKRDYEYLLRLWENVRSLTLESTAPSLVYEEGSLVKRAIRDLYGKDVDEVMVEGAEAYKEAKAFMKMLTPSHAKNVKQYKDAYALFQRYQVEHQLDQIYNPQVQLKSGGYLVINPTEALVSIDVNSGRATKERTIESTALKTNLEAAEEVARQCRLRDLAGLLVIDFIDMEENRNNRAVEKRLKDSMKNDRARVAIGRISSFGLLEMSRQRMRSSVLEGSSNPCPACEGTGHIRSTESTSLRILRAIEEQSIDPKCSGVTVRVSTNTGIYLLNHKRVQLHDLETRYDVTINVDTVHEFVGPQFELLRKGATQQNTSTAKTETVINVDTPFTDPNADNDDEAREDKKTGDGKKRRRRRRRRGGDKSEQSSEEAKSADTAEENTDAVADTDTSEGDEDKPRRRRRRGRRGGRRRKEENASEDNAETQVADADAKTDAADTEAATSDDKADTNEGEQEGEKKPRRRRRPRHKKTDAGSNPSADSASDDNVVPLKADDEKAPDEPRAQEAPKKKAKPRKPKVDKTDSNEAAPAQETATKEKPAAAKVPDTPTPEVKVTEVASGENGDDKKPSRRGWWNRRSS